MGRRILYFDEYKRIDSLGITIHPYYDPEEKAWYDDYYKLTMVDLGKLYNINEEELTILRLTYG